MKSFYYIEHGKQIGPINIKDLSPMQINQETLIWFDGLSNWKKAKQIPELSNYLSTLPPPIPDLNDLKINELYDLSYKKEVNAIYIGIAIFIIPLVLYFINFYRYYSDSLSISVLILITFFIRIISTFYVIEIAKRQNRKYINWGIYAFLLPSISLINIGSLPRLMIEGTPLYKDLKRLNYETDKSQEIITDEKKSIKTEGILKIISLTLIITGLLALILMFFLWH